MRQTRAETLTSRAKGVNRALNKAVSGPARLRESEQSEKVSKRKMSVWDYVSDISMKAFLRIQF